MLAWIAAEEGRQAQAAVRLAAAEKLGGATGNYAFLFPNLAAFHADCDQRIRSSIDAQAYETARRTGQSLRLDDAVAYALGEG